MMYLVKQRVWLPLYEQYGVIESILISSVGNVYKLTLEDGSIEYINETQIKSTK